MKQVEVTILGQGYVLSCPDGGETLLASAVADVDREMTAIRDAGRVKARERIAVLAALNVAYQLAEQRVAEPRSDSQTSSTPGTVNRESIDWRSLITRIDTALDHDGHLL